MAILPVGSTEQHANHLPLDVDMEACHAVALGVSARTGALVLPPLAYGDSGAHKGFAGTIALSPQTMITVVGEVCAWVYATGVKRILLLNGHWLNLPPLQCAVSSLQAAHDDIFVKALSYWDISPRVRQAMYDAAQVAIEHAGDSETSLYLALHPELVQMAEARDERIDGATAWARAFFSYLMSAKSATGGTGNPLAASAEKGRAALAMAIEDLSEMVIAAQAERPPIEWLRGVV
jgi:creatinine amidohydrolase